MYRERCAAPVRVPGRCYTVPASRRRTQKKCTSMMATQELVVPRSIPIMSCILADVPEKLRRRAAARDALMAAMLRILVECGEMLLASDSGDSPRQVRCDLLWTERRPNEL